MAGTGRELVFSVLPLLDAFDEDYLRSLRSLGLKTVHYDVMDSFTGPGTRAFGPERLDALFRLGFDVNVHLMVSRPAAFVRVFAPLRATRVSFHAEALASAADGAEFCAYLKRRGKQAGAAFKMGTDVARYLPLLREVDYVTLMSVEPGRGGQKFDPRVFGLLADVNTALTALGRKGVAVEFDGGITAAEIARLKPHGNYFVSGSWFHKLPPEAKRQIVERTAR